MSSPSSHKAYTIEDMVAFAAVQTLCRSAGAGEGALRLASLEAALIRISLKDAPRLSTTAFADVRRLRELADALARDLAEIEAEASDKMEAAVVLEPIRSAA